jgi:hypothetical protein
VGVRDIDPHQTVDDVLSLGGSAQAGVALRIFRNGRSGTPGRLPQGLQRRRPSRVAPLTAPTTSTASLPNSMTDHANA